MNILQEYLFNHGTDTILNSIGNEIDFNYLKIDKTNNSDILNHLDYYPMISSRTFTMPKSKSLLNVQFRETYHNYISFLITLPKITDKDYMRLCYYLILQKRIKEANEIFKKINYNNIIGDTFSSYELQYDYLIAYLDFSDETSNFKKARDICKKYNNFTIISWKNMFKEIEDQLNEYDGIIDYEKIFEENNNTIKTDKRSLSVERRNEELVINYKNISEITIKFYLIDVELLYTTNINLGKKPQNARDKFNYIIPDQTLIYQLTQIGNNSSSLDEENFIIVHIPKEYENKNIYIKIIAGDDENTSTDLICWSDLLKYSINEVSGEIKITDEKYKDLPMTYIKCFYQNDNELIKFYKDGFTDFRGKFNFLSINNNYNISLENITYFYFLIISKDKGSCYISYKNSKYKK
jgi:hypothetical protein